MDNGQAALIMPSHHGDGGGGGGGSGRDEPPPIACDDRSLLDAHRQTQFAYKGDDGIIADNANEFLDMSQVVRKTKRCYE